MQAVYCGHHQEQYSSHPLRGGSARQVCAQLSKECSVQPLQQLGRAATSSSTQLTLMQLLIKPQHYSKINS
jgi:hypothetical protein